MPTPPIMSRATETVRGKHRLVLPAKLRGHHPADMVLFLHRQWGSEAAFDASYPV